MFHIGERLKTVASMVPVCQTMADIGTDHGYVPAYLALSGQCRHAIASDIAEGPCRAAAETRDRYSLFGQMEIRTAPGLKGLRAGEAEAVVIAGMGGATIVSILEEAPEIAATVETFVLQPMNAANLLRRWLVHHGYRIADEALCKENDHIYVIIKAVHAGKNQKLSVMEEELGPCIMDNQPALWKEFIQEKSEHYHRLLRQMEASPAAINSDKYKDMKNMLEKVDALIN